MNKAVLVFIFFGLAGLLSCNVRTETLKPVVSGRAGEVMVVVSENLWDSSIGTTLKQILSADQDDLPQAESIFDVIHVVPDQFSRIFNTHRNIIFVRVNPDFKDEKIAMQKDRWSTPQLVIDIQAKSRDNCLKMINDNSQTIVNRINQAERNRVLINYKRYQEVEVVNKLKGKYHISLIVPKGYSMDVDSSDFIWLANETPLTSQGILVYFYPYTGPIDFTVKNLIGMRDRFLKKYVSGPVKNTYMSTETMIPPQLKEYTMDNRYTAEMRGLWKLENGFMGGPFVSISTVDEKRNRIITVEGFVYAPHDKKRELLRQVESIVSTLKIE